MGKAADVNELASQKGGLVLFVAKLAVFTTPTEKKTHVRRKAALRTGSSGAKNVRASGMLIVEAMKCNQPPQPLHNTHMHESNEGFTMSDSGKVHIAPAKGPWTPGSGDALP